MHKITNKSKYITVNAVEAYGGSKGIAPFMLKLCISWLSELELHPHYAFTFTGLKIHKITNKSKDITVNAVEAYGGVKV